MNINTPPRKNWEQSLKSSLNISKREQHLRFWTSPITVSPFVNIPQNPLPFKFYCLGWGQFDRTRLQRRHLHETPWLVSKDHWNNWYSTTPQTNATIQQIYHTLIFPTCRKPIYEVITTVDWHDPALVEMVETVKHCNHRDKNHVVLPVEAFFQPQHEYMIIYVDKNLQYLYQRMMSTCFWPTPSSRSWKIYIKHLGLEFWMEYHWWPQSKEYCRPLPMNKQCSCSTNK